MVKAIDTKKILSYYIAISFLLFMPLLVSGQNPSQLEQTNKGQGTGITYECGDNPPSGSSVKPTAGNCEFEDLILAVNKVVKIATTLAVALSVVVLAWAGFNYMISGANTGKRTAANNMLKKVLIGIAVMLSAYLIVNLITTNLLNNSNPNYNLL